jgi:CBS domain-containing protein
MKNFKISDLMVPLAEYATVSEEANLCQAVMALEKAQEDFDHTRYRHRAILVLDKKGKVIGKISQLDVLRALEPKYDEILEGRGLHGVGFSKKFLKTMLKDYAMFASPLKDICKAVADLSVVKVMCAPTEGEYLEEHASLDQAIHQLVIGHHQSLLVTRGPDIIGILRLTDVFAAIFHAMKECVECIDKANNKPC